MQEAIRRFFQKAERPYLLSSKLIYNCLSKYIIAESSRTLPVTDENGNVEYIVYTRLDASDMQSSLNETTKIIIVAVSIALFLTAIMGYVFAQTLTGPILALTRGAKNMAEGNNRNKGGIWFEYCYIN